MPRPKKFPTVVYCWRDEDGYLAAVTEVGDLPEEDGIPVGKYMLEANLKTEFQKTLKLKGE